MWPPSRSTTRSRSPPIRSIRTTPMRDGDGRATGFPVRAGAGLPDIATDLNPSSPGYGNVYAVWADSHGTGNGSETKTRYDRVVFTMSTDGGLTWSPLRVISKSPAGVQALT